MIDLDMNFPSQSTLREDVSSHSTFDGKVKILDLAAVQVCST